MLVQENLPGPEYSIDVLARSDGEVVAVVPRERLRVDSGIAVCGVTKRDAALEEFGRMVAERIHLTGVANVQVKDAASGEPALLEVNPRFPGTMPLTVASGIDMPKLCVGEALGSPIRCGRIAYRPAAMVRMMEETVHGHRGAGRRGDAGRRRADAGGHEPSALRLHRRGHAHPLDVLRREAGRSPRTSPRRSGSG